MKLSPAMKRALEILAADDVVVAYHAAGSSYARRYASPQRPHPGTLESLIHRGFAVLEKRQLPDRAEHLYSLTPAGRALLEKEGT